MPDDEQMSFKPSDFYIGVVDFFSVILPGALVTYFLKPIFYAKLFGDGKVFPLPEDRVQRWIVFLLATYIIGNLIFVIGSFLLDKIVYDWFLRDLLFKKNFDLSYLTATAIRNQYISSEIWINDLVATKRLKDEDIKRLFEKEKREIVNTFKWAQHYIAIKYPETLVDIKKFEADSKFFRSLVVVFIVIFGVMLAKAEFGVAICFLLLSLLSLYRYGDLRYKATDRAYEIILTLDNLTKITGVETGVQTQDNRVRFLALPETVTPYRDRIAALTKGLNVSSEVLAIPANETWEVANSSNPETLFCLRGRCILKKLGSVPEEIVVISTNAIVSLPQESSFVITNRQQESLLLLSVK